MSRPSRSGFGGLCLGAALVLLAAQVPEHPRRLHFTAPQSVLPSVDGRRFELDAGPIVYTSEDDSLPLTEIAVALKVGSFLDPPGKSGLASLTGMLLRRAGTASLTGNDFDDRVDLLGLRIDSTSGTLRAGASLSAPSWVSDEAIELFVEMLRYPRFQEDRVASAKDNLMESMSRRNEDPLEVLQREWEWLIFGNQHFSTTPLTTHSLEGLTQETLMEFHRRHWRPENMILAVSGDFDPDVLMARLEELFTHWPAPQTADSEIRTFEESSPWPPPGPVHQVRPGLYHVEADVPQAKVALGHRADKLQSWLDPDRFALEVLNEVLGGRGAISRINGRLRTVEGLVYRATVRYESGSFWPEDFQIFFDTESANVARAVKVTLEELERIRSGLVHPKELAVVKQILLSALRLRFDTAEEIAGYFAQDELLGRPHGYWETYQAQIEEVTAEDVRRAAQSFLHPDRLVFLVVGRWKAVAGGASAGESALERASGYRVTHLPARDPLTMEPLDDS